MNGHWIFVMIFGLTDKGQRATFGWTRDLQESEIVEHLFDLYQNITEK